MLKVKIICCAVLAACLAVTAAPYQTFKMDQKNYVPFDNTTTVTVECPDEAAAKWIASHYAEWYGDQSPKVKPGATGLALQEGDEAYAATVDDSGVKIACRTLAGARWASYTLRQQAIAKRGTFKTEGRLLPVQKISDRPHLAFRAVHLCWFPEVRPQQMERAIRLAALLKFNYAIIEPWGMYESKKHPWWHWPNPTMTQAEVKRLEPLFEPAPRESVNGNLDWDGWCWCISNPETQRVLRELIAEMHENFGNPPYFHLGCDEAQAQTCPECVKTPNSVLVCRHITGLAEFVKSRGARPMIWHDMLLARGDPRWKGFVHCGNKETATLADTLPKDVIICDWQYSYGDMKEKRMDWPTMAYFKEKGFPVAGCPWRNYNAMKPMADYISKIGGFGFIETTWHHLRGSEWERMYQSASHAAWGSMVSHGASFQLSLRLVGHDMKVTDYLDTGYLNYQVPPGWWVDNN